MRANNVVRLLPYNLFEYALLTEAIATGLGLTPGALRHHVLSLHAYEPDLARLGLIAQRAATATTPPAMPPMPSDREPFEQAALAYDLTRATLDRLKVGEVDQAVAYFRNTHNMHEYWTRLAGTVVVEAACSLAATDLRSLIPHLEPQISD
jgi:hypothetical protein